ncbi:hypothetical protein RJ45_22970 [Photobacterium gaetbulicola]|uniref:Peptidoglycan binding-like domain-containing protein n=1 Tax=Photobacterium gaetbulicola TaxID=1295392 RepID=A0A0B9GQ03_9GAMM|nr:peptidoglycan-binding protein [Photobacterium gaetbulicola]KHT60906.1 hypothetical protein RJ45_22970 [Photobacterium gaetbulicola]
MMDFPELNRGDRGEAVVQLQTWLNRVGAMLKDDGDFGAATERAVRYAQGIAQHASTGTVDGALWSWLGSQPEPFPLLATNGLAFIAREETGGLNYYSLHTRWPHYPALASGVTIGVGYDLRFTTKSEFNRLWSPHLPPSHIRELEKDIGRKGSKTRVRELKKAGIEVPFDKAWKVFVEHTLPEYHGKTLGIYPTLNKLPDLCRSTLVSLVFNRGSSLNGERRREMRAIRGILVEADNPSYHKKKIKMLLADVEDELISMQRLWSPETGVYKRRQKEANLWRRGLQAW